MTKLKSTDGHRWAVMKRYDIPDLIDTDDIYLTRWRLVQTPWFGLYLHKINRPDNDRHLHDHPWAFASLILRGGYVEERARFRGDAVRRVQLQKWMPEIQAGEPRYLCGGHRRLNVVRLGEFHSIRRLLGVPTWSLVLVGRRRADWGYATETGFVPHDVYHAEHLGKPRAATP